MILLPLRRMAELGMSGVPYRHGVIKLNFSSRILRPLIKKGLKSPQDGGYNSNVEFGKSTSQALSDGYSVQRILWFFMHNPLLIRMLKEKMRRRFSKTLLVAVYGRPCDSGYYCFENATTSTRVHTRTGFR